MHIGRRWRALLPPLACSVLAGSCVGRSVDQSIGAPECATDVEPFGGSDLQGRAESYSESLVSLGAAPLCQSDASDDLVQVLWLPSFDPTVSVRLRLGPGPDSLVARTSETATDELSSTPEVTVAVVDSASVAEFVRVFGKSDFWTTPTEPEPYADWTCTDGAQVVVERLVSGRYHVVSRHSCEWKGAKGTQRLAAWLLAQSGTVTPEVLQSYW